MPSVETAVQYIERIAANDSHGYDQISRWPSQGTSFDCSSLVITAFKEAGFPVGGATYTGNMRRTFSQAGFEVLPNTLSTKRGDILLNDANHVAVCVSQTQIAEASINEFGGVTGGKPGDQTGREIRIRGYYDFPWNCILRYPSEGTQPTPEPSGKGTKYCAHTGNSGWLLPVFGAWGEHDGNGTAGIFGEPITAIAVDAPEYKVHIRGGAWLEPVHKYDPSDWEHGMAGLGGNSIIDGVAIKNRCYRVHLLGGGWLEWVTDYDTTDLVYGMAGIFGKPIDGIQVK
jgi:hypothetical protein